jgi:hypothetical protein
MLLVLVLYGDAMLAVVQIGRLQDEGCIAAAKSKRVRQNALQWAAGLIAWGDKLYPKAIGRNVLEVGRGRGVLLMQAEDAGQAFNSASCQKPGAGCRFRWRHRLWWQCRGH